MTKEQEKQFRKEQKMVFDWMFEAQEERLKKWVILATTTGKVHL